MVSPEVPKCGSHRYHVTAFPLLYRTEWLILKTLTINKLLLYLFPLS